MRHDNTPTKLRFTPSKCGTITIQMRDGSEKVLEMNRAERRKYIKQNRLVKVRR